MSSLLYDSVCLTGGDEFAGANFRTPRKSSSKRTSMRLIIHSNQYCRRGDAVNARHLALGLKLHYGVESLLVADAKNRNNDLEVIENLRSEGMGVSLYSSLTELNKLAESFEATHAYFLKNGRFDGVYIKGIPNLIHAVFQHFEPHGDKYVYVSDWLFDHTIKTKSHKSWLTSYPRWLRIKLSSGTPYFPTRKVPLDYCPSVVELPPPDPNFRIREIYSIPGDSLIIGRFGGREEFNDPAGHRAVKEMLSKREDIFFVFFNTNKFVDHQRVIFVDEYITEAQKSSVINDCSLLLNCRLAGESFGFSICEALAMGKPIVAPNLVRNPAMDAHHLDLLEGLDLLYDASSDLVEKIERALMAPPNPTELKRRVAKFSSEAVSKRMHSILLSM